MQDGTGAGGGGSGGSGSVGPPLPQEVRTRQAVTRTAAAKTVVRYGNESQPHVLTCFLHSPPAPGEAIRPGPGAWQMTCRTSGPQVGGGGRAPLRPGPVIGGQFRDEPHAHGLVKAVVGKAARKPLCLATSICP